MHFLMVPFLFKATKLFYIDPRQQIKANLVETSDEDLLDPSGFSSVLCEAGKVSGWLHCTDPSGVSYRPLIFNSSLAML